MTDEARARVAELRKLYSRGHVSHAESHECLLDERVEHLRRAREIRVENWRAGRHNWRPMPVAKPKPPSLSELAESIDLYWRAWRRRHRAVSNPSRAMGLNRNTGKGPNPPMYTACGG